MTSIAGIAIGIFRAKRSLRDLREYCLYPLSFVRQGPTPDSHIVKRRRILRIAREFECNTFLETGTFYGQMVNAVRLAFTNVYSCELSPELCALNQRAFADNTKVRIFCGDSSTVLAEMLACSTGRALFWLDGHYSGPGTAQGRTVSPIIEELKTIGTHERRDHCILIDDVRLFRGAQGYPTLEEVKARLHAINSDYQVLIDRDCLLALPAHQ